MILPMKLSNITFSSSLSDSLTLKRRYLSDYDQITQPQYLYTQSKDILLLSFALQSIELMDEYSKHLEKQIEEQSRNRAFPDFDLEKALPIFFSKTFQRVIRNVCNFIARKCYEAICVASLPLRLCDRLTKDVGKSAVRKVARYGQQEAARRIFSTCCDASLLRASALFTVDCGYALYTHFFGPLPEEPLPLTTAPTTWIGSVSSVALWVTKRAVFHFISIIFFSGGYSLGLMVRTTYTPVWFGTILDALGGAALNQLLS
jgi:hypothetical protein